jgi:hypothetical protein
MMYLYLARVIIDGLVNLLTRYDTTVLALLFFFIAEIPIIL